MSLYMVPSTKVFASDLPDYAQGMLSPHGMCHNVQDLAVYRSDNFDPLS